MEKQEEYFKQTKQFIFTKIKRKRKRKIYSTHTVNYDEYNTNKIYSKLN